MQIAIKGEYDFIAELSLLGPHLIICVNSFYLLLRY